MVQIQEASRSDLALHMIAAAARDHGPAVLVLGSADEDRLLAELVLSEGLAVELVTVAPAAQHRDPTLEACGPGGARIRVAETLERALFGKNAWITPRRAAAANALPPYEYDAAYAVLRFNPLAAWSEAQVQDELRARGIAHSGGDVRVPPDRGTASREATPPHR
jgi:hypothetical protein